MDDLRSPNTVAEWAEYHAIRRHVLFELRGRGNAYDATHPDEHLAGHFPLVFWSELQAVGVIRVDIDGARAVFRRVAVRAELQRRGAGRRMIAMAEDFARQHGCNQVESHVDLNAVGFYERCGFLPAANAPAGTATLLMRKSITAQH